jgi:hypothetical protein
VFNLVERGKARLYEDWTAQALDDAGDPCAAQNSVKAVCKAINHRLLHGRTIPPATAFTTATDLATIVMTAVETVGGPDNRPVRPYEALRGKLSVGDISATVVTLVKQGRLIYYAETLPTNTVQVVRGDGPRDPRWVRRGSCIGPFAQTVRRLVAPWH